MTRRHIEQGVWFVFIACAIAFAPYVAPLKHFSDDLVAHPQPYLGITIAMTAIGLGLFVAVGIVTAFRSGRRMTDAEAQAYASAVCASPIHVLPRLLSRQGGGAAGREQQQLPQIKDAFRNGDWLRNAEWRRFLLSFAAGMLWVGADLASPACSDRPRSSRSSTLSRSIACGLERFWRRRPRRDSPIA